MHDFKFLQTKGREVRNAVYSIEAFFLVALFFCIIGLKLLFVDPVRHKLLSTLALIKKDSYGIELPNHSEWFCISIFMKIIYYCSLIVSWIEKSHFFLVKNWIVSFYKYSYKKRSSQNIHFPWKKETHSPWRWSKTI